MKQFSPFYPNFSRFFDFLKRALSLTLASVMLLGMMVVGSSAAGYPDVTEEENVEAIEVLQTVGVMEGDNNGNFNPDDYVTREQMAVIMSKLLNLDYNYYQGHRHGRLVANNHFSEKFYVLPKLFEVFKLFADLRLV